MWLNAIGLALNLICKEEISEKYCSTFLSKNIKAHIQVIPNHPAGFALRGNYQLRSMSAYVIKREEKGQNKKEP